MEIKTYAPVLIPTLNRYEHFRNCVESLAACTHAEKTDLIIGLDYPPEEKYCDGWNKISVYLESIVGFRKVIIIRRESNYGAVANYMDLIQIASKTYDRFIFTEDDNVFSPNFLDYINKGLNIFDTNPNVIAICGYSFPMDFSGYPHNYYYLHDMNAWGYATWNKKFLSILDEIKKPSFLSEYYSNQSLSFFTHRKMRFLNNVSYLGKGFFLDVFLSSYLHSRNKYVVAPSLSKVRNMGHDGTGLNSTERGKELFSKQTIDDNSLFNYDQVIDVKDNRIIDRQLDDIFSTPIKTRILKLIMFILLRVFLLLQGR